VIVIALSNRALQRLAARLDTLKHQSHACSSIGGKLGHLSGISGEQTLLQGVFLVSAPATDRGKFFYLPAIHSMQKRAHQCLLYRSPPSINSVAIGLARSRNSSRSVPITGEAL